MEIELTSIKVGERMRKDYTGIEELAASIAAHGQIEPIVLDENNVLIAGERRLRACTLLKKRTILAISIADLNDVQKKEIELEENIQRANFTWQEEVNAKLQLHKLKQQIHGEARQGSSDNEDRWSIRDTAKALDESVGNVSMDIQLAKGIKAFPDLLKEKTKSAAFKRLKNEQKKILESELARRAGRSELIAHPDVVCGECITEMQKMESASVDLIVTDPPYGIDVADAHTYKRMTLSDVNFNDTDFDTFDLLDRAFKEMYRILRNGSHLYVFFAIDKYEAVTKLLLKHGFAVHKMPLIWDKGSGSYPSQMTTYVHSYEPLLHCWKEQGRKLNGTPRDVFSVKRVPGQQKIHPTQKPTELLRDLISMSSNPGELVFDPFAGSGATLVAARECQRRGKGIELNPVYHQAICARLEGKEIDATQVREEAKAVDPDLAIELDVE